MRRRDQLSSESLRSESWRVDRAENLRQHQFVNPPPRRRHSWPHRFTTRLPTPIGMRPPHSVQIVRSRRCQRVPPQRWLDGSPCAGRTLSRGPELWCRIDLPTCAALWTGRKSVWHARAALPALPGLGTAGWTFMSRGRHRPIDQESFRVTRSIVDYASHVSPAQYAIVCIQTI